MSIQIGVLRVGFRVFSACETRELGGPGEPAAQQLEGMGFPPAAVRAALDRAHGDLHAALAILTDS